MKTFLNVLYRRILYKIPLKLLLVLLAVFAVLFACFSSAITIDNQNGFSSDDFMFSLRGGANQTINLDPPKPGMTCVNLDGNGGGTFFDGTTTYNFYNWNVYCTNSNTVSITIGSNWMNYYYYFFSDDFLHNFYPEYTSLQCQTEYNLIPVSSVDQNYCTTNNLCPVEDCPGGDLTPGVSNIFINDIFHPGAFNVIMNIPEEIDWDYAYTNSGQNFNIDVVGYNVDYEKMQSVIDLQNYKPTDDDFSEIISVLAPYSKIIIFFVVLFSLWAMIKKPFKSKKL